MANKTRLFDILISSLRLLELNDSELYRWERNRLSLTHALACHLSDELEKNGIHLYVDMCPSLSRSRKTVNPDILVHDRTAKGRRLAVICSSDYLTEEQQSALRDLRSSFSCEIALAITFFPTKNYMLIYRASDDEIEYYHFDRNTLTLKTVRKKTSQERSKDDSGQLKLRIR